ncbi:TKL family protein kinase [Ectocarpus siliculosus]|uniref:TKL family protein kinase n=1 Tax=Ectocarpus siliculosus TaxID=2880 RepID=D8LI20_ECTSI|nr:TKL family protein kinase [Ectocarpus siliculosus]|eukprot:CBN79356.1 TKL family protein kinase [Ectocarpus siliculosus]
MARAPVSTMLSSDNPRPPPQRRRTSSGRRLTAVAAATAAASIEEGNEEEQAPVWRPVSFEKAKSEPSTAAPPPARRTTPGRPGTTCTLLASVGPSFLQAGSAQDSCSSVNSGCFDQGSSSGRGGGGGGGGGGSVCASPSSVASGTGRRRARTNSSASVLKAAATSSVTPRSTASAPMFSPGGGGGGRRHRGGGERPRSLPPPHGIPNSRSSGRPLRHHGQQGGGVAEVGGGHHPTRQRSSGGVPLPLPSPSPSPSPAAAAAAAAASWAEVEALALTSIVPAVREAADSVARLMKASGGGGGGGGNWVGWCGSVARTLRRAVRVLAKATAHDEQVERVLMEDIQESICEMSEIMQCYASRGLSAEEAFWSGLCHRRQSEAELAIALASQRLELVMKVRAGYSGGSSSSSLLEASDRHSRMQRRSSQEILEDSKTRLREWRLHQVEIPATEVEVVGDEVLGDGDGGGGGGGGGRGSEDKRNSTVSTTVYLGSCMGLNAAVKAFSFKGGGGGGGGGNGSSESTAAPAPMPLDDRALRRIVGDVCSGMAHLADLGFVHGGLSSSNVLLDARGRAKISDLGPLLRTPVAGNTTRLRYTAPEVLAGEDTSLKSDAYSFGMLVLECLTRRLPWQQEDDEDAATTAAAIDDGTTTSSAVEDARLSRTVMSGDRPGVPGDAPRDLARVAKDCWAHDPASRPDMVRVLEDLYPTGLTATSAAAGVAAGESGEAVPTNSMTTRVDDDDDHHHHRHGEARVLHGDEDDSSGLRPGPRGAGAVRRTRGIGDGTTPRSFELSSPRKMFPFPSSGAGSPLATMTTPGTPCSSSGRSRRRATSLETFSTLGVSSTTSSARSSVSRHVRGASAGGGGGGRGGRVLGVGGGIAGGGVLFAERSHTMPVRTQRSRSRKGDGADAPSRAESLPCVQYLAAQEISHQ